MRDACGGSRWGAPVREGGVDGVDGCHYFPDERGLLQESLCGGGEDGFRLWRRLFDKKCHNDGFWDSRRGVRGGTYSLVYVVCDRYVLGGARGLL